MRLMNIAAAVLALGLTAQAEASVYLITYTGKITSGSDTSGLFGFPPGTDLTGMSYKSKYYFTDPDPANVFYFHDITYFDIIGHPLSATLSINGITNRMPLNMTSDPSAFVESEIQFQIADGYGSELYTNVSGEKNDGVTIIYAGMTDYALSPGEGFGYSNPFAYLSVNQYFNYTFSDEDSGGGGFTYNVSDLTNPLSLIKVLSWAKFQPKSVSYQPFTGNTAAVPEPSTWALMIVGLGGVGAALRRRVKRKPALTA